MVGAGGSHCSYRMSLPRVLAVFSVTLSSTSIQLSSALNSRHYGDPKNGCLKDEHNITVQGIQGDLCSPICSPDSQTPCPTDVPSGVTAQPQCEIICADKTKGCCLTCSPSTDE